MRATLTDLKNNPSLDPKVIVLDNDKIVIKRGSAVKKEKFRPIFKDGEELWVFTFEGERSTISREHVILVWNEEARKYRIINKATNSRTLINRRVLSSGKAAWLEDKDTLQLGEEVVFLIRYN